MALHKDLREEMRVEASLAEKVSSPDLAAVYPSLLEELKIAVGLRERLGRSVASMPAAECVCGGRRGLRTLRTPFLATPSHSAASAHGGLPPTSVRAERGRL